MTSWLEHLAFTPLRDLKWYDMIAAFGILFGLIGLLLFMLHLLSNAVRRGWSK